MKDKGFTLVEVLIVLFVFAILVGLAAPPLYRSLASARRSADLTQLEAFKVAMVGNPSLVSGGKGTTYRTDFGYLGDWGLLPGSLEDLIKPRVPGWQFDKAKRIGAGWNGPYIDIELDELKYNSWGDEYVYITADYTNEKGLLVDAALISYGADRVLSGDDHKVEILKQETTASVRGYVMYEDKTPAENILITIYYPMNGSIAEGATRANEIGYYEFSGIPFGDRSLFYEIVGLVYVENTARIWPTSGQSMDNLEFQVKNALTTGVTITWMKVDFDAVAYYEEVHFDGTTVWKWSAGGNRATNGDTIYFSTPMTVRGSKGPYIGPHGSVFTVSTLETVASPEEYVPDITLPLEWTKGIIVEILRFKDSQKATGTAKPVDIQGVWFTITFSNGTVINFVTHI